MGVYVSDEWSFRGLKAVVMQNEKIRLTVLPELGAKIYDIVYLSKGVNVLWHNPRIRPKRVQFGSRFDDVWSGGWDEIFPNDAESTVGGERYPDMGEVWSVEWDHELRQGRTESTLVTSVSCPITPVSITRSITMRKGVARFDCMYEFTNLGRDTVKFLWKIHPAFAINSGCRISVPATEGKIDRRYSARFATEKYPWPMAVTKGGKKVDISVVKPRSNTCSLHYLTGLREGKATFSDSVNGLRSTIRFQKEIMNNVWLFLAYGGWRGVFNAVVEPSTSYPYDLAEAISEGNVAEIDGGGKLRASVSFEVDELRAERP